MSAANSSRFGSVLKQFRVAAGLSQEELAARASLSSHGISDLERGARRAPRPRTLRLLADALGLSGAERADFIRAASAELDGPREPEHTVADERNSTASAAKLAHTHNLPLQPTALLGRERDVDQVVSLLQRNGIRLVTITGPGGVGKTRLSTQAAVELVGDFLDGVWMAPLARLTDPAMVLPAIARAVGTSERGGAPPLIESVCAHLRSRRALLLLDNFEHLLAAATEVAELLAQCPELKVLVTSRAPLHLRGECEYALSPLELAPDLDHLPPPERLMQFASIALFVERAQAALTDFRLTSANARAVAAICARLDGLPLAIELAATRVKLLEPHALLVQLDDAGSRSTLLGWGPRDLDERQQTLRRALAWSYALLTVEERRLFRRLSIFIGGWTLEAAEAICATPSGTQSGTQSVGQDVLEGISRLLDHSLICRQATRADSLEGDETGEAEPRFNMLHVIREYGVSLLETGNEMSEARAAHAAYFAERARTAGRAALALSGHSERHWSAWLRRERHNLVSALTWLTDADDMSPALWIAATLAEADILAHLYAGARRRLDHLLDVVSARADVDPEARLLAISRAAILAAGQEDLPRTQELRHEQVALARAFGVLQYVADALAALAYVMLEQGTCEEAAVYAEEAVALARQTESSATIAYSLETLAIIRVTCGDLDQAQALAEEGLQLSLHAGFLWGQGINSGVLALVKCSRHDSMGALRLMRQGMAALRNHGWLHAITGALQVAACAWAVAGEGERSARLLGAAAGVMALAKGTPEPALAQLAARITAPMRAALGEECWERSVAAGRQLSLDEAITEAFAGVDEKEPLSGT